MRPLYRGLLLAALQLALVSSLGAKLLYDRATRPRVWAKAAPVDPDALFRGRYVQLRLEVHPREPFDTEARKSGLPIPVELVVENDRLVAVRTEEETGNLASAHPDDAPPGGELHDPVAFFIPEHVADPSRQPAGSELWVEVTIPRTGPPRPIRLGVRTGGALTPLEF